MRDIAILIHGTFARDAAWLQSDSELSRSLREISVINFDTEKFLWSGKNSFADRHEAATRLANRIAELTVQEDVREVHLVAHSHGGNIAVLAAAHLGSRGKLRSITTLGTPFISLKMKNWATALSMSVMFTLWIAIAYSVVGAYFLQWIAIPTFGVLIVLAVIWVAMYFICRRALERARLTALKHSVVSSSTWVNDIPFLCIRYRFDEANLWLVVLSVFRFSERLLSVIYSYLAGPGLLARLIVVLFINYLIGMALVSAGSILKLPITTWMFYIIFALALILPIMGVLGTLVSSHRFGLSGRPTIQSLFIDVIVSPRPPTEKFTEELNSFTLGLFRAKQNGVNGWPTPHSLGYLDPVSIASVRNFVAKVAEAEP